MKPGETLKISIGAVREITAAIKWMRQGLAGLAFETEINIDEARKNDAAAPKAILPPKLRVTSSVPTVGWFNVLKNPHQN